MSSTIIGQDDFPYDIIHRGEQDAGRHNKRVNDAVRKQLKDIISEQDIITSEGNKKIKLRLKYLDQYRFIHNKDRVDEIGRDEFDDLEEGELISRPQPDENGVPVKAGDEPGDELYEAEYTIEELTDILMKELSLPNLDERKKNEIVSERIEWDDVRKQSGVRSLVDRKKTLLASLLRKQKHRAFYKTEPLPIIDDDFRFRTYTINQQKHSNAVIILMMDRSGSMWQEKIYAAKALFFWIVQFLKRRYDKVEIKFISHDYNARQMSEKEFFTVSDSGGTRVSSAYEMCRDMIRYDYPQSKWNIYCYHASDGDSWNDEDQCIALVREMISLGTTMFGYTEIDLGGWNSGESSLLKKLRKESLSNDHIRTATIEEMGEVMLAIKHFFGANNGKQFTA